MVRYAHYDNNPAFSDFSAFGGWSSPHAKQYAGDVTQCSLGVDKNYAIGHVIYLPPFHFENVSKHVYFFLCCSILKV